MKYFGVAVIVDLVRSRDLPDRSDAQRRLVAAFTLANSKVTAIQPLAPTVGDESQALYADVPTALLATLLVRLHLPHPIDCRFGIGAGQYESVGDGGRHPIQDGPAWWSARDAILQTKTKEVRQNPSLRTWYLAADGAIDGLPTIPSVAITNAYLLCRDELVSRMHDRGRRLLLGLLHGQSQVDLARAEGITESAVSQSLRKSGAYALQAGFDAIRAEVT